MQSYCYYYLISTLLVIATIVHSIEQVTSPRQRPRSSTYRGCAGQSGKCRVDPPTTWSVLRRTIPAASSAGWTRCRFSELPQVNSGQPGHSRGHRGQSGSCPWSVVRSITEAKSAMHGIYRRNQDIQQRTEDRNCKRENCLQEVGVLFVIGDKGQHICSSEPIKSCQVTLNISANMYIIQTNKQRNGKCMQCSGEALINGTNHLLKQWSAQSKHCYTSK